MKPTACLLTLLLLVPLAAQDNLLPNGDFEQGDNTPANWGFSVWSAKPSRATWSLTDRAHTGQRALRLEGQDNAAEEAVRSLAYSLPVNVPEGVLKLTGVYQVTGAASAQVQVRLYNQPCAPPRLHNPSRRPAIPQPGQEHRVGLLQLRPQHQAGDQAGGHPAAPI